MGVQGSRLKGAGETVYFGGLPPGEWGKKRSKEDSLVTGNRTNRRKTWNKDNSGGKALKGGK